MEQANLEKIHVFWARSLGCNRKNLRQSEPGAFTRDKSTDYNSQHDNKDVDIFIKDNAKIFSCHENHASEVKKLEKRLSNIEISEDALRNTGLGFEKILGPAFLSFTDSENFQSVEITNCRVLGKEDKKYFQELKSNADSVEIENSISDNKLDEDFLFGKFEDGKLVAVSGYEIWDNEIAFITVFVSEKYRGKGFGKQVVSEAVEHAIKQELVPCYRTLEKWKSSVGLAKKLGFEKYATTYLVELKKK